jgi:hypothetical protein
MLLLIGCRALLVWEMAGQDKGYLKPAAMT